MRPSSSAPTLAFALALLPALALACGDDDPSPAPTGNAGQTAAGASNGGGSTQAQAGAAGNDASGGATAGASGNGGTSASGPDVCDTGSCLSCTACINTETCKQPYQACFENNPGCVTLSQCYLGCSAADCRDTCDAQADEPSRKAARAFLQCSLCDACQTTCGKDPSCP